MDCRVRDFQNVRAWTEVPQDTFLIRRLGREVMSSGCVAGALLPVALGTGVIAHVAWPRRRGRRILSVPRAGFPLLRPKAQREDGPAGECEDQASQAQSQDQSPFPAGYYKPSDASWPLSQNRSWAFGPAEKTQ